MQMKYPQKPVAPDPMTESRWEHTSLRRKMLTGQWHDILVEEIERHVPSDRARAWGVPDMSSNIFKSATGALSVLYQEPPSVGVAYARPNQADPLLARDGLIDQAGLWPLMQRVQMLTIGLRECFLRVDLNEKKDGLLYRIVTPDFVFADSPAGDPSNPNVLHEYRLRHDETTDKFVWTVDLFDLRNPNNPKYQVHTINQNGEIHENVSEKYLGSDQSGDSYPYRDSSGRPFIPYTLYHAEVFGGLFDAYNGAEIVAGALNGAVLYTYFLHLSRDCAHPQRWMLSALPAGMNMYDNDLASRRNAIATDPASILLFAADPDLQPGQQPQIGQFQAGGDVEKTLAAISAYERKIASTAGISGSDIQKMSGDPRSGYAIALSRSGLREAQRRYRPAFTRGDTRTLEISAMIANRFLGMSLPENGYRVEYHAIPLSPEETKGQREQILSLVAAGLMSKVEAIQVLHPDLDDDEAIKRLELIRKQNIQYS
tara:strand:+ start:2243 stop:3697 length:1455 start_codon:yes stop_codon:yes gene_type:complete